MLSRLAFRFLGLPAAGAVAYATWFGGPPLPGLSDQAAAVPAAVARAAQPADVVETPRIARIEYLSRDGTQAWFLRHPWPQGGFVLGMAFACGPDGPSITAYFGGYPDGRPVQLAVREPDGSEHRFGQPERGGPATGFHDPRIPAGRDLRRFTVAALQPGALISNGYRSFWNDAPEADNLDARYRFLACARYGLVR